MNKLRYLLVITIVFTIVISLVTVAKANGDEVNSDDIAILFTNDIHSNLEAIDGKNGFARMNTVIEDTKDKYEKTFVVDAGDFSMGTPFQVIYQEVASEIRMLGEVGIDVTVFGNHEFDHKTQGLTNMLNSAMSSGDTLPHITIANIDWEATFADPELESNARDLKDACDNYGIKDYVMIERGGANVAVFGIMGKEADEYAPLSGLIFADQIESAQRVVDEIEKNEDADMIICVSHSGMDSDDLDASEDKILAEEVDGIDFIASGHSHSFFEEPVIANGVVIGAAGEYAEHIGEAIFTKTDNGYDLKSYRIIPLDSGVLEDETILESVAEYRNMIDDNFFDEYNLSIDDVLTYNEYEFTDFTEFGKEQGEEILGNILSDAVVHATKVAEGDEYEEIACAVVPHGVIRASIPIGEVTVEDMFNVLSLGIGPDGVSGYPMVSLYLTGEEIKTAAEIDISVSELMGAARLYTSGVQYTYNPNRLMLNRVTDTVFVLPDGTKEEIIDDQLYRVVADLYSCQMLGAVEDQSFGLLSVTPKDKNGDVVADYEDHIIYMEDGKELKQWHVGVLYMQSFEGGKIPEQYSQLEGRKVEVDSTNIFELLKNPNKFFWILSGIVTVVIVLLILVITLIVKRVRKIKNRNIMVKKIDENN